MRARRFGQAGALTVVVALLAVPITAAGATPRPSEPSAEPEALVQMVDVEVADFVAEAESLPPELDAALERDAGMSGAEWLAQAEASAVGIEVVDALRDSIDVLDSRLDGLELVVTVGTQADARVVESVGARAEFGPAAERMGEPIEGLQPAADLRGGTPYFFTNGGQYRCSVGFVGIDTVTSETQMMSAGHCQGDSGTRVSATSTAPTSSGGTAGSPLKNIGVAGLHVRDIFPNPGFTDSTFYDLGVTPVTEPGWVGLPEVVTWGGGSAGAPLSSSPLVIRDAGPAMNGATLCKSGSTTGWTCGPITATDQINLVGSGTCPTTLPSYCVGSIEASVCVRAGDSGGAAVVGSRAVGITSASTIVSGGCPGGMGVFSTLYSANPEWEQIPKVFPTWEPLIGLAPPSISSAGLNRFDSALVGSISGGNIRHDVELALDLGGTLTDEVDATGAWSIDIGAVPNGTRYYTLQSSWGSGVQQSAPVVGRFLKAAATRLAGATRYETAIAISQYAFPGSPEVPVAYIAGGAGFADALSAGPAARAERGPLLLTDATTLPAAVAAELTRLNPDVIVIVGGTGVVSAGVETALAAYAPSVTRVAGANRYETSRLIAERVLATGAVTTGRPLWVATGAGYPDALSAGAAAATIGAPILLVDGAAGGIPAATETLIDLQLQSSEIYIAGGTGVVSAGVETALDGVVGAANVQRFGGANRFDTSLLINQFAHPGAVSEVFITYGYNFPDALAGGVLAGVAVGPMYISSTACVDSDIVDHILFLGPSKVTVLGGSSLLSNNARDLKRC